MARVYVIAEEGTESPVKIGMADDPWGRLATLQTGNHRRLEIRAVFQIESRSLAYGIERMARGRFAKESIRGEWFSVDVKRAVRYIKDCGGGRVRLVPGRQPEDLCPIHDAC